MGNTGGHGGINGGGGGAGAYGGGGGGAGGDGYCYPNLEDCNDTVIVTGCSNMKGEDFVHMMMSFGQIKICYDGDQSARIDPKIGIGIVTFEDPSVAARAIKTSDERGKLEGNVRLVSVEHFLKTPHEFNGRHKRNELNTAWRMWNQEIEESTSKGGKGGSGWFGFGKGEDGKPGGPNGKGGEGGKGGGLHK